MDTVTIVNKQSQRVDTYVYGDDGVTKQELRLAPRQTISGILRTRLTPHLRLLVGRGVLKINPDAPVVDAPAPDAP